LTVTYYSGTYTSLSQLTGLTGTTTAPSGVGSYTVVASFPGTTDYKSATALANFTISAAGILGDLFVLNQTASGALTLSGNAGLNVTGVLQVDSSSATAVQLSGNAEVNAATTQIVGGDLASGNASFVHTPKTYAANVADPLANLATPTGGANQGAVNLSHGTLAINPGLYSSITVSGSGHLILNPGVYTIGTGGFTVTGSGVVTQASPPGVAPGVLIYNNGALTVSGNASVNLTAQASGMYAAIAIFQARGNTSAVTINGNANLNLNGGILYDANVQSVVTVSVYGNVEASLVVNELTISGNGVVKAS
jgi:hypothetical protein